MKKLIIRSQTQTAELFDGGQIQKSYLISTAKNGLGCSSGSFCTPAGRLKVVEKVGEGAATGTIFKSRVSTGLIWSKASPSLTEEDLVLTRILWLAGDEDSNQNTISRHIYLHGTNHEETLGSATSFGCIRFSNRDILEVFEHLDVGSQVWVE